MKKTVYFVILLLTLLALAPLADGLVLRKQFENDIAMTNDNSRIRVTLLNYHSGWLTSQAKVRVLFTQTKTNERPIPDPEFTINTTLTHGPFVYNNLQKTFTLALGAVKTRINYPAPLQPFISTLARKYTFLTATTFIRFNGDTTSHIECPAVVIHPAPGVTATWKGMSADYATQLRGDHMQTVASHATIGEFALATGSPIQFGIQPVTLSYQGTQDAAMVWLGESSLAIPSLVFVNAENKSVALKKIHLNSKTSVNANHLYDATQSISLDKLDMPWNSISSIAPANITISVSDLNAKAFAAFLHFAKRADANNTQQGMPFALQSITPKTTLHINGDIKTPMGELHWEGKASHFATTPAMTQLSQITDDALAEVNIKITATLATQLAEMYLNMHSAAPAATATHQHAAKVDFFDEKVATMMKQGNMTLPVAMRIMTLQEKHLTPALFEQQLQTMTLNMAIRRDLTELYAQALQLKGIEPVQTDAITPESRAAALIAHWVSQGFLLRDQDSFIIDVIKDKGSVKINGVAL